MDGKGGVEHGGGPSGEASAGEMRIRAEAALRLFERGGSSCGEAALSSDSGECLRLLSQGMPE